MLENYVLALGIRGYKKWSGKWIRTYRTIEDATRTIFETGEVGLGTMTELQRQREVLTSASDKAKDTISLSQQANTILNVGLWLLRDV